MIKITSLAKWITIGMIWSVITACGGGSGGSSDTPAPPPSVNNPPTVDAGENQSIVEQSLVTLVSTASDSDGSIAAYQWTQIGGETVTLANANSAESSFTAPTVLVQQGSKSVTFSLQVTDDDGASSTDSVTISVTTFNEVPVVALDSDLAVNEGSTVQLDASAEDEDGNIDSVSWAQTTGEQIQLTGSNTLTPEFTAPNHSFVTTLGFELTVTDNEGAQVSSSVNVTVNPIITGVAVDDLLVGATVQLLDVADQSVIFSTQTGEDGRYSITPQTLPSRYILSISGGTLNDTPFLGTLDSLCLSSERLSCNTTPLSTLVKRYAEQQNNLENGDKTRWIETLSDRLGFDLSSEPFVHENQDLVPLDVIRAYLQNGEQLEQWIATTLEYIENDVPNEAVENWFPTANLKPVVDAGRDQTVDEQTQATLTATASDSDGTIVSYLWTQTKGTSVILNNADTATATFTMPALSEVETLTFELTVTDSDGGTATDSVNVTVNLVNTVPSVEAGDDQTVDEQSEVTLAATVSDPDGTIISYSWTQTNGTSVVLNNASTVTASFTAPTITQAETLSFELVVTDNEGAVASDSVDVTVNPVNATPTVDAGDNQSVDEVTQVTLAAVANDVDGSIKIYQWTQTSGTTVTLSNADTATATFTAPILTQATTLSFSLTVTDNEDATATDSVNVTVNPVNLPPEVNAGNNQSVREETLVTLAGASSDSDGSITSYQWIQSSGTIVILSTADNATATFNSPTLGETEILSFTFTVTDNEGGSASDTVNVTVNPGNALPLADAGSDFSVNEQSTVELVGSGSDSDGTISSFLWTQADGIPVVLHNANNATARFTSPTLTVAEKLTFRLTVSDNVNDTNSDLVDVTIMPVNAPPTAKAGSDQSVDEQTLVTLAATASDFDGSISSYLWSQTDGTTVTLTDATSATATFTSPTLTVAETLTFSLTVTDNEEGSDSDSINVTVNPVNAPPSVDAGEDQTVDEQTLVTLAATTSDSDGSIVSYLWTQTDGSTVTLTDETSATASFTSPTLTVVETLSFSLTVIDNEAGTTSDSINVTVEPVNITPIANAGADQAVSQGDTVALSGALSTDEDGNSLTYAWLLSSVPSGSIAVLSAQSGQDTSFVADLAGTYIASLTVNDGLVNSNADTVEIVATPVNSSPTGIVSISGSTMVGETLTADNTLVDTNGLGTLSYQWRRTLSDVVTTIDAATEIGYTLTAGDLASTMSVVVSYTDKDGFEESVTSGETSVVTEATIAGKPNILLIIADDQGLDASAQYSFSSDLPSTANIDALAASGITFDNTWATPASTTTRGTLITGQHGVNSGIRSASAAMDSNTATLQRYMKSLSGSTDYQTAVVGKWHLGGDNPGLSHPTDSGIDYYAGTITGTITDYYNWELTENGATSTSTEYHTTKLTDLAINWLTSQNDANTPWFMWLAYVAPHSPLHLPPSDLHNRTELTGSADDIAANKRNYYLAAIEAMDSEIGRLLDSLPADERDNTLIVYIGDNGTPTDVIDTAVYDQGHSKNSLFEGGIRVPMVVSGNGVTRQNERESALVNTSDFYATFTNYISSSITRLNDSYSFLGLLTQTGNGLRSYNYCEFESDDVTGWVVRNGDYKYIEFSDGSKALYKVSEDLNEATDLSSDPANADIITELANYGTTLRGEQPTGSSGQP